MSFQNIHQIEKPDFYIDLAFGTATKAAKAMKSKHFKLPRNEIIRKVELTKVGTINRTIAKQLPKIVESFPKVSELTPFYYDMVKCTMDVGVLRKSLAAIGWVVKQADTFTYKYTRAINDTHRPQKMMQYRREYYGRVSSLFKQTKEVFHYLHQARRILRSFPSIKLMPTVAICGFPNIGKTTLLSKLTGSKPEIANYAFTTTKLNMGYAEINKKKIQFIDTPGTLNRFNKMNYIEKQAYLVAKHCADVIVYIYDLSEPYSLRDQHLLLNKFKEFDKPILIYLSKTDIIPKDVIENFKGNKQVSLNSKELNKQIKQLVFADH